MQTLKIHLNKLYTVNVIPVWGKIKPESNEFIICSAEYIEHIKTRRWGAKIVSQEFVWNVVGGRTSTENRERVKGEKEAAKECHIKRGLTQGNKSNIQSLILQSELLHKTWRIAEENSEISEQAENA